MLLLKENAVNMDNKAIKQLENDLWESADLLRAGSKLTSQQYCMPVHGLLFLRYAYGSPGIVNFRKQNTIHRRTLPIWTRGYQPVWRFLPLTHSSFYHIQV